MTRRNACQDAPLQPRIQDIQQVQRAREDRGASLSTLDTDPLFPRSRRMPDAPYLAMPAMPPINALARVRVRLDVWRRRAWIRALLRESEARLACLACLGFRRSELAWALRLPHTVDATEALRHRRLGLSTGLETY